MKTNFLFNIRWSTYLVLLKSSRNKLTLMVENWILQPQRVLPRPRKAIPSNPRPLHLRPPQLDSSTTPVNLSSPQHPEYSPATPKSHGYLHPRETTFHLPRYMDAGTNSDRWRWISTVNDEKLETTTLPELHSMVLPHWSKNFHS